MMAQTGQGTPANLRDGIGMWGCAPYMYVWDWNCRRRLNRKARGWVSGNPPRECLCLQVLSHSGLTKSLQRRVSPRLYNVIIVHSYPTRSPQARLVLALLTFDLAVKG